MNRSKWIIFIAVTIGIFALLIITSDNSRLDVNNVDVNAVQSANSQDDNIADHVFGKINSKVTMIEYGDYQCPGCGTVNPSIEATIKKYKDQLQYVFRNFPLTTMHPNAKAAAATVEAAGLQGKYWEMHSKVYAGQSDWENLSGTSRTDLFAKYATSLGLDATKFISDMASAPVNSKINYDYALGQKAGVNATPSFFLNGTKLDSTIWGDNTKLNDAINTALTKAGIELPK